MRMELLQVRAIKSRSGVLNEEVWSRKSFSLPVFKLALRIEENINHDA